MIEAEKTYKELEDIDEIEFDKLSADELLDDIKT